MTTNMILVTGGTGQQGGAVVRSLLRQGAKVRLLTRNRAKAQSLEKEGAEVAVGDFTDRNSLDAALKGVKKLFLMTTFFEKGIEGEVQQGITLIDAAKTAGVEHLVFTSVGSADQKTGIPHFESKRRVEEYLQKSGLPATILRPTGFMENFGTYFRPSPQGIITLPLRPDTKLQMIAVRDIGEFGAAAFLHPAKFIGQAIDLAGDALTMPEVAALLSRAGRPVEFQQMPENEVEAAMGRDFALMFRWFNEGGYSVDIPALRKRWGIPLTTFKEAIADAPWVKLT
ncbi:MAG: NmrA/HSCARG family protein [Candidatus Manganitrophaceae bacterium]